MFLYKMERTEVGIKGFVVRRGVGRDITTVTTNFVVEDYEDMYPYLF